MPKNLTKRGNVWYFTAIVNGKRMSQSLSTEDLKVAKARARGLMGAARAEKWDVVEGVKRPAGRSTTVGDALEAYRKAAAQHYAETGRPRPSTVEAYAWALGHLVRRSGVADPMAAPLSVLTAELDRRLVEQEVAGAAGDVMLEARARRSAAAICRGARSVFSAWAREAMRAAGVELGPIEAWVQTRIVRPAATCYELPERELIEATLAAGAALKAEEPDLYAVWLLCYGCALRAGEAAAARWDWLASRPAPDGSVRWFLRVVPGDGWQTKSGRPRDIPVGAGTAERLQELRQGSSEWILDGASWHERRNLIERRFARWLRELGWTAHRYPKAAHELRKLQGSEWYTRYGVEVASAWLGHADIATTHRYYCKLTRHPVPVDVQ